MASFGAPVVPPVANQEDESDGENVRPLRSAEGSSSPIAEAKSCSPTPPGKACESTERASSESWPGAQTETTCFRAAGRAEQECGLQGAAPHESGPQPICPGPRRHRDQDLRPGRLEQRPEGRSF